MQRNKRKIVRAVTVSMSLGFCRDLMIKLRQKGYEILAISSSGEELTRLSNEDGFQCIEVEMARHISILADIKSLIRMIHVFSKEKPYVVHSMTPKAGLICMISAWLTRVPIRIHTFTGLVWPTSTGIKCFILKATDWLTCACATNVIPEGQGVLNDLLSGGITKKPMKVLGYGNVKGVDVEKFNPQRFPSIQRNGTFVFLFVGRIVRDKGINELIEAFTKLNEKYRHVLLNIVGEFEDSLDPISELTKDIIASSSAINVLGPLYNEDLLEAYASADCFVLPSYREGFPNTVLEAGAMGLPSIVTDVNGSREIILDGENGYIVPPKNAVSLYSAMEKVFLDINHQKYMSQKARNLIIEKFDKNYVQECQIRFYEELLS